MSDNVIYRPGEEPENIRKRLDSLFAKLDSAYPDKVIVGLNKDHKHWGETVTDLYRKLGYESGKAFLSAYGYNAEGGKGGRAASVDPASIIAQLKEKYPEGTTLTIAELKNANPEIPWKSLANKANEYFGTTLAKQLVNEGILIGKSSTGSSSNEASLEELITTLQKRYEDKKKPTTIRELLNDSSDLSVSDLVKYATKKSGGAAKSYLVQLGILQDKKTSTYESKFLGNQFSEEKLAEIETALLAKYSNIEVRPNSISLLKRYNPDLDLSHIDLLVRKVKGISATDHFISLGILAAEKSPRKVKGISAADHFNSLGILAAEKSPEEELGSLISVLKERYVGTDKKAHTISELTAQNQDLPIFKLKKLIESVSRKTQKEYLLEQGILSEPEWVIAKRLTAKRIALKKAKQKEKFGNDRPVGELVQYYADSYEAQTTCNPFFDIEIPEAASAETPQIESNYSAEETRETTVDGFVIRRGVYSGKPYVKLDKYLGTDEIVTVPEGVTEICWRCFSNSNLRKVIVPKSVKDISSNAFCTRAIYGIADKDRFCIVGAYLLKYIGAKSVVTIPEGVEEISYFAFEGNSTITAVYLPESIKVIRNDAFSGCRKLTSVVFSEKTTELECIENEAFLECTSLKSINLPSVIRTISIDAFERCNITSIIDGFELVGNVLVKYTGSASRVTIPAGISTIGPRAFRGSQVVSVTIPEGVTTIGEMAFYSIKTLENVHLPSSLMTINGAAFEFCDRLSDINLENVQFIDAEAFEYCSSLSTITLSDNLKHMGDAAFKNCTSLSKIIVNGRNGVVENSIPKSISVIPDNAFLECSSLKAFYVPGSIKRIGSYTFRNCSSLSELVLSEGIEEIGEGCFSKTANLTNLNIPSSVKSIGKNAFIDCRCSHEIILPKQFEDNKGYYGIPDENGCFIEKGILKGFAQTDSQNITVSSNVIVIERNSLDNVVSCSKEPPISQISLPDSVRIIRQSGFGYTSKYEMNIPCGYLLQKTKLPAEPLDTLLGSLWKYEASMLDWVSVYIYQNNKQLNERCVKAFKVAPNAFIAACLAIFKVECTPKVINRISEIVYDLRNVISQEYIDAYYIFAKSKKAKKAVSVLSPFASAASGGRLNEAKTYNNKLEEFCDLIFSKHDFERIMPKAGLKDSDFENSDVKYSDSGMTVSGFVLECAIVPYIGQLIDKDLRKLGGYINLRILRECDEIASHFEKASFSAFIEKLVKAADRYGNPHIWIPICRYGSGAQISSLISNINAWNRRSSAVNICREAIMLSDTREAMIYAEKQNWLDHYAELRGKKADVIRDTELADFGFNGDGKKIYDIGSTVIEASIADNLSITLYDTVAAKAVKSIPKRGADIEKYEACSADYAELKKNVKKVVKARNDILFEYFLSGKRIKADIWMSVYMSNPLLNKVARLLVWKQGNITFTLCDSGAIDSRGKSYDIKSSTITVAHPIEMDRTDLEAWQRYYAARGLKQPFAQVWERAIEPESIKPNRYEGCTVPINFFRNAEKHGLSFYYNYFLNDVGFYVTIPGCKLDGKRTVWHDHELLPDETFTLGQFAFDKYTRKVNHLVTVLDRWTVYQRIKNDDVSVADLLDSFTLAQIVEFIGIATENNATNVTALLLDYNNKHYADFDPMAEFTLEL